MSPVLIAQLAIALGPPAIQLIEQLIAVWSKPSLTQEEVLNITSTYKKNYDAYIAEAKARLQAPVTTT